MTDRIYPNTFYGDNSRWFIGVIEDINDPMQLGRVRVRINGIHTQNQEDIQTTDLPWAQVLVPSTEGGISGIGRNPALQPGAQVFGIFLDGSFSQTPLVFGSIPHLESASPIQQSTESSTIHANRDNTAPNSGPGTGTTGSRNQIRAEVDFDSFGGNSNPEIAFNFFVVYGFTPQQSAGVVGNLMQESGPSMSTTIKAAGSEQSFGIAQWNASRAAGNRLGQLKEFASDLGKDWTDLDVQLRFIIWELENYSYLGLSQLRASSTIEAAVIAFETKYERPSAPHRSSRIAYARDVYNRMTA